VVFQGTTAVVYSMLVDRAVRMNVSDDVTKGKVLIDGKMVEVARVRITEVGRDALGKA
jgi:hypothetical protein